MKEADKRRKGQNTGRPLQISHVNKRQTDNIKFGTLQGFNLTLLLRNNTRKRRKYINLYYLLNVFI